MISGGIIVLIFHWVITLSQITDYQPYYLTLKRTVIRFPVTAYISDNYRNIVVHSGNTDKALLCSRCTTMAQGWKGTPTFKELLIQWTHIQTLTIIFSREVESWVIRAQHLLYPVKPGLDSNSHLRPSWFLSPQLLYE